MRSKIIDPGIIIGKELQELLLEEDDLEVIGRKRNQFISISDDLAKEISDTLISKNKNIAEFLKAEATNCDSYAKNCKTIGDVIIKNAVIIILKSFDDHVTSLGVWFVWNYDYSNGFKLDLQKSKPFITLIEETVLELYDLKMKIELRYFRLNNFEIYFSWY